MTTQCPGCGTTYKVPVGASGVAGVRLRCKQCGAVFSLPVAEEPAAAAPLAPPVPDSPAQTPVPLEEVVRRVGAPVTAAPPPPAPSSAPPSKGQAGRPPAAARATVRGGFPWRVAAIVVLAVVLAVGGCFGWRTFKRGGEIKRFLAANVLVSFGGPEAIRQPGGLAVIPDGRIAVLDREEHQVKIFSPSGELAGSFGGFGIGDVNLWDPEGLAYAAGKLATFDTGNGYVKVFDLEGRPVAKYPVYSRFYLPRDLALGEDGTIVAADTGNHRLVVMAADGSSMRDVGKRGQGKGELFNPYSVILLPGGNLATVDVGNHRISVFDAAGGFLRGWEHAGREGQYSITPTLGWVRDRSLIVMTDQHLQQLQVFAEDGRTVGTIGLRSDGRHVFENTGPIWVDQARPGELVVLTEQGRIFVLGY